MSKKTLKKQGANKHGQIWLIFILFYISFMSLFVMRVSAEIFAIYFFIIVVGFRRASISRYAKHWIPFIGFFFLYEFLRGYADDISPFYNTTLLWIYKLESLMFTELPTTFLQRTLLGNRFIVNFSLFFYASFFYFPFFSAFAIWLNNTKKFEKFASKFLLLSFIGLLFFFLIPTAPPWLIDHNLNLGLERVIYTDTILKQIAGVSIFYHFIHSNAVAALPSLHTAWPVFTAMFIIGEYKRRFTYFLLIVPIMISFSVILSAEHFLLDVVAGWLLAYLCLRIPSKRFNSTSKKIFFSS
jgi:membrane-associated phospholipid phosphatase